jgi:hypothetical protein
VPHAGVTGCTKASPNAQLLAAALPERGVEGWHPSPANDPRAVLAFKDGRGRPDFDY